MYVKQVQGAYLPALLIVCLLAGNATYALRLQWAIGMPPENYAICLWWSLLGITIGS